MLKSDKYIMPRAKIEKYLLAPGKNHSGEFFGVGYTQKDVEKLNEDINEQFDMKNAVERVDLGNGKYDFNIYMKLGVTVKRTFKTVWRIDDDFEKPRFITAYRKDYGNV